jgi:hypothetical protein
VTHQNARFISVYRIAIVASLSGHATHRASHASHISVRTYQYISHASAYTLYASYASRIAIKYRKTRRMVVIVSIYISRIASCSSIYATKPDGQSRQDRRLLYIYILHALPRTLSVAPRHRHRIARQLYTRALDRPAAQRKRKCYQPTNSLVTAGRIVQN